jgi:hypothetical protein
MDSTPYDGYKSDDNDNINCAYHHQCRLNQMMKSEGCLSISVQDCFYEI